jgi:hypothetical protein
MATPTPVPAEPSGLPPLPVNLHALIEFDEAMDRRLRDLEHRFGGRRRQVRIETRQTWQRPNKPR